MSLFRHLLQDASDNHQNEDDNHERGYVVGHLADYIVGGLNFIIFFGIFTAFYISLKRNSFALLFNIIIFN